MMLTSVSMTQQPEAPAVPHPLSATCMLATECEMAQQHCEQLTQATVDGYPTGMHTW